MKKTIPILRIAILVALTLVFSVILFGEKDSVAMSYVMYFIIVKVLLFVSASVVFLCLRWKAAVKE